MKNYSKKKQAKKNEIARIKKELIDSGEQCFFSGYEGEFVAFHICPIGTHPEHEANPRNIVLSFQEYNDIWIDRGTAAHVITIPNVEKGFARMFEVDELCFNQKMRIMQENLPMHTFEIFNNKVTKLISNGKETN